MLKKSIIAGAAVAVLAIGTLGGMATEASAGGGYHHGGKGSYHHGKKGGHAGFYYKPYKPYYKPHRRYGCTPKYRVVRVWKPHRGWVRVRTYAGRVCWW